MNQGKYAIKTQVGSDKSKADIEHTLERYNADGFMYGREGDQVIVAFRMLNRHIKFQMVIPAWESFTLTEKGRKRTENSQYEAYEQGIRQKWRALALVIKAKLEAVESGISSFEHEFLANIVLPDGSTVGDFIVPQIETVYSDGKMPPLLPGA